MRGHKMPRIHVCPVSLLGEVVRESGACDVISLLREHYELERPPGIAPERHLRLGFNDITEAREGQVLVQEEQMARLIAYVSGWDRQAPLVIHCLAGVSRSTGAAFASACALRPDITEMDWALRLRAASPTASPNARLVALADALLGRQGRMIAAIDGIGRGAACQAGVPFHLDLGESGA